MIQFSPEKINKVNEIIARYPEGKQKGALIPLLHRRIQPSAKFFLRQV